MTSQNKEKQLGREAFLSNCPTSQDQELVPETVNPKHGEKQFSSKTLFKDTPSVPKMVKVQRQSKSSPYDVFVGGGPVAGKHVASLQTKSEEEIKLRQNTLNLVTNQPQILKESIVREVIRLQCKIGGQVMNTKVANELI